MELKKFTNVTGTPNNLKVDGYLDLQGTSIISNNNYIISGTIGSRNDVSYYDVKKQIIKFGC